MPKSFAIRRSALLACCVIAQSIIVVWPRLPSRKFLGGLALWYRAAL